MTVDVEALRARLDRWLNPAARDWVIDVVTPLLDEVSAQRAVNAELRAAAGDAWSGHAGEIVGLQRDWSQANARAEAAEAQVAALTAESRVHDVFVSEIIDGAIWEYDSDDACGEDSAVRYVRDLEARAAALQAQRDDALTLLADAIPDPRGAIHSPQWHRRMDRLAASLDPDAMREFNDARNNPVLAVPVAVPDQEKQP